MATPAIRILTATVSLLLAHAAGARDGCVEGDCVNGMGRAEYADGTVVSGRWSHGIFQEGTHIWPSGVKYEGAFKYRKPQGQGKLYQPNGVYEGSFFRGEMHGDGVFTFDNGDVYEGEFEMGKKHGRGTLTLNQRRFRGDVYVGEFRDGQITGSGTYTSSNGDEYTGAFLNGKRHGVGTLRYAGGLEPPRVGRWENDRFVEEVAATSTLPPVSAGLRPGVGVGDVASRSPEYPTTAPVDSSDVEFGRYFALVIGNNDYEHLTPLRTAYHDAEEVTGVLAEEYGFEVTTLLDASREMLVSSLASYRKTLRSGDNLLIYYAGHGWFDEAAEKGYWLPIDATDDHPKSWVSNDTINDALRENPAKHVMVVADSCYSGTLVRGISMRDPAAGSLGRLRDRRARTVLTSGANEPVEDGSKDHSVFAQAFLDALLDNQTVMEGMTVFEKVRGKVMIGTDPSPQYGPIRETGHDGGDFLFVRTKPVEPSPPIAISAVGASTPEADGPAPPSNPDTGVE